MDFLSNLCLIRIGMGPPHAKLGVKIAVDISIRFTISVTHQIEQIERESDNVSCRQAANIVHYDHPAYELKQNR